MVDQSGLPRASDQELAKYDQDIKVKVMELDEVNAKVKGVEAEVKKFGDELTTKEALQQIKNLEEEIK